MALHLITAYNLSVLSKNSPTASVLGVSYQVLSKNSPTASVTAANIQVLRSKAVKTNSEYTSKFTVYVAFDVASGDPDEQVSKVATYVALREIPITASSMINGYAVLMQTSTSSSKLTQYVVGELRLVTTKFTAYSVLSVPLATSSLKTYVVLRAPFAVDKLTQYAVLDKAGPARVVDSKLTAYAVLYGQLKTSAIQGYAALNDPTPRYIYTPKLTVYSVVDPVLIRMAKYTSYVVLEEVPRVAIDAPKITGYAVMGNLNPQCYLSLDVPEVLTTGAANARLSFMAPTALTGGNPSARLSLLVSDVLTGGLPTTRCALIVAEALVSVPREPYMINPSTHLFPASSATNLPGLAFDVKKSPNFNTGVTDNQSGREVRLAFMEMPRWDFEMTYEVLPDEGDGTTDLKKILGFFLQRQGSFDAFLFKDVDDYEVTNNLIGTANGVTTNFYLKRDFGGFNEIIGQLDQEEPLTVILKDTVGELHTVPSTGPYTVIVTNAANFNTDFGVILTAGGSSLTKTSSSSPASGQYYVDASSGTYTFNAAQASAGIRIKYSYQVDEGTAYTVLMPNELVFSVAPANGIEIYATFKFYFVCRFTEDSQEYSKFADKLWELQTCTFKSTLDY